MNRSQNVLRERSSVPTTVLSKYELSILWWSLSKLRMNYICE